MSIKKFPLEAYEALRRAGSQAELAEAGRALRTAVRHHLKAIAETEGVDGVFFGPADLSASMGHRGQPGHPEVQKVILDGIATVRAAGKAAGILATDPALAQLYLDAGALFVAVGVDTTLLVKAASSLVQRFSAGATKGPAAPSGGY